MSRPKSHKHEMFSSPVDAADLLRRLADQLDAGGAELGQVTVKTDGPVKIKQSIKTKSDKVSFKLKLKYETALTPELNGALGESPEEEAEDDKDLPIEAKGQPESGEVQPAESALKPGGVARPQADQPAFKAVKKNMSAGFKTIKQALAGDSMPSLEQISAFAASCERMTTFAGKGDPKYQDFLHHVGDLKAAGQAGDAKALARAMAEIGAMKKACHSQFK